MADGGRVDRWTTAVLLVALLGAIALLSVALPGRFPATAADSVNSDAANGGIGTDPSPSATKLRLRFKGMELEILGIALFSILAILARVRLHSAKENSVAHASRLGSYILFVATIATAGVIWVIHDGGFNRVLRVPAQYWLAAGAILAIVVISARWRVVGVSRQTLGDLVLLARSPATWAVAGLITLLILTQTSPQARSSAPMGAAFVRWFVSQPRVELPDRFRPDDGVSLVTFIDYQCPACRSAARYYAGLLDELNRTYPGAITFWTVDFPLDSECNSVVSLPSHLAACEAAAAVRLLRRDGRPSESSASMEQWLWSNQAQLSRQGVFDAFRRLRPDEPLEPKYGLLEEIRRDVLLGQKLGVRGTPTYLLNGVRLPFVPAVNLRAAIEYELQARNLKTR